MNFKIKIVSHASVIVDLGEVKLLTDPWLFGNCFNDGWSLKKANLSEENITQDEINSITHLYLSHEHPDHFHIPSLKNLVSNINFSNVEILCKSDPRTKQDIVKILKKFGYKKFTLLNHLKHYNLNKNVSIRIYHHRHIDSALLIFYKNKPLLINLNDCEMEKQECIFIKNKFGSFPVVLNQFSIAGFDGIYSEKNLLNHKEKILNNMIDQHVHLGAKTTIPFASFCWFSSFDNKFLNKYHNSLKDVSNKFQENKLNLYCMEPPSNFVDFKELISKFKPPSKELIEVKSQSKSELVKTSLIIKTIIKRISNLKTLSNRLIFYLLESHLIFFIKDNSTFIKVDFRSLKVKEIDILNTNDLCYLEINSQPLYFAFANSFGIQTLGVSGRYKFINYKKVPKIWRFLRIISSLDNNKTPLRVCTLFNPYFYKVIFTRKSALIIQIKQQLNRFRNL